MNEIDRMIDFDWGSFDFDVASERLRELGAHALEKCRNDWLYKVPIDYPDRMRTIRMMCASNEQFQELTPYSLFGPHRYSWIDLVFLCECFADAAKCESSFDRVWNMEMFSNLFGHLLGRDFNAKHDVYTYSTQEIIDAYEKITWTMTDHLIPKNTDYRTELAVFFEVLTRRAKLFCIQQSSSKLVEYDFECRLEEIHSEMLKTRAINEDAIDLPVKDEIDRIRESFQTQERMVDVNIAFVHRVNLFVSWIERELVETSEIEFKLTDAPKPPELTTVIRELEVRARNLFTDMMFTKRQYTPFMHSRRLLDIDRIHFKYVKGKNDMPNRKPSEYLHAKTNKDWLTFLISYEFGDILEHDPETTHDLMFHYYTNLEQTCPYDALISDPTSLGWWNRNGGFRVHRSVLMDRWFFDGSAYTSVLHFYVSMVVANRMPKTLPDPKQMMKPIDMHGFNSILADQTDP